MKNNYLLLFYKNGQKDCFSLPSSATEKQAFDHVLPLIKTVKYNIKRYLYITNGTLGLDVYQKYYNLNENEEFKFDERQFLIDKKIEEIRFRRDVLLNNLDIPFMRSVESSDDEQKQYISKLKNFLRDLPSNLRINEIEDIKNIFRYNPFNNIFSAKVLDGGQGYEEPPIVKIEAPNGKYYGFEAKGIAFIKDGKIEKVEIVDYGCGYSKAPYLSLEDSPRQSSLAKKASIICGPPQNSFDA